MTSPTEKYDIDRRIWTGPPEEDTEEDIWAPSEDLPERIKSQRDFYWQGKDRPIFLSFDSFTTGKENDWIENMAWPPMLPESIRMGSPKALQPALRVMAEDLDLPEDFWEEPLIVRRAMLFRATLNQIRVDILPDELIIGGSFAVQISAGFDEEELEDFVPQKDEVTEEGMHLLEIGLTSTGAVQGHTIPDHRKVLNEGFKGIEKEAEEKLEEVSSEEEGSFYRALIICCKGAKEFSQRYAEEARKLAEEENDEERREELLKIASICDRVPYNPPESFWGAIHSVWFQHMMYMIAESYPGPGTSLGRIDQYLYPYYESDVLEGDMSRDEAKEIAQSWFVKHNYAYDSMPSLGRDGRHAGDGQLFTVGGCDKDGNDAVNELTHLFIDAFYENNMLEPKMNVRVNSENPDDFLKKLAKLTIESEGSPFITQFDNVVIEALEKEGLTHEEALDYAPIGCLESTINGSEGGTVDIHFNMVKPLELVFTRGKDYFTEEKLGPDTGDPKDFESFEEFKEAYKAQLEAMIEKTMEVQDEYIRLRGKYLPCPYVSIFMKGCMESGEDVKNGGAYYAPTTFNGVGIATVADSLAAVKKTFQREDLSVDELVDACLDDWEGQEELQLRMKNKMPKFGNDVDFVDNLGREIIRFWADKVNNEETPVGRKYRAGFLSWNHYIHYGRTTMATPDGREITDWISNGVGPTQGMDVEGPTAAMRSVAKLDHSVMPSSASYTWTINPSTVEGEEGFERFASLIRAFNRLGGSAWQTNCVDADTLRDAQKNPEDYQNLLVRVTGYNAYFVTLGRKLQNEIISRTEHEV